MRVSRETRSYLFYFCMTVFSETWAKICGIHVFWGYENLNTNGGIHWNGGILAMSKTFGKTCHETSVNLLFCEKSGLYVLGILKKKWKNITYVFTIVFLLKKKIKILENRAKNTPVWSIVLWKMIFHSEFGYQNWRIYYSVFAYYPM